MGAMSRNTQWLTSDVNGASCTLTVHLSDGSAPDYVSTMFSENRSPDWSPIPDGFTAQFTVRCRATSAGQKLTIHWVLTGEPNQFLGKARLQSVTLAPVAN